MQLLEALQAMKRTPRNRSIEQLYAQVLAELGATSEPSFLDVKNTPKRVAAMLQNELLAGYKMTEADLRKKLRMFPAKGMKEFVLQPNIPVVSVCAHHMLPFAGTAVVAYLPGKYLMGLSKLSRIVDFFAARLQVQERLGGQVADFLMRVGKARAAFVLIEAEHQCMACRGVKKPGVRTITSSVRPQPPSPTLLAEFYALVAYAQGHHR